MINKNKLVTACQGLSTLAETFPSLVGVPGIRPFDAGQLAVYYNALEADVLTPIGSTMEQRQHRSLSLLFILAQYADAFVGPDRETLPDAVLQARRSFYASGLVVQVWGFDAAHRAALAAWVADPVYFDVGSRDHMWDRE